MSAAAMTIKILHSVTLSREVALVGASAPPCHPALVRVVDAVPSLQSVTLSLEGNPIGPGRGHPCTFPLYELRSNRWRSEIYRPSAIVKSIGTNPFLFFPQLLRFFLNKKSVIFSHFLRAFWG